MTYAPFIIAQEHVDFLQENKIFFHPSGNYPPGWFKPTERHCALFDIGVEPWSDHRNGPTFSSLGAFSYSRSCFGADAQIGRYCAIGLNVAVMAANHPTDRVSMCGFDYAPPAPFGPYARHQGIEFPLVPLPDEVFVGGVVIESDVWIGANALIARGVTIGTGAIIGANSVVTRDVAPYTLVAGNPARVKRRRFADELCDRLLASRWWEYPFDAFAGMETTKPERFLEQFDKAVVAGDIQKMPENRINIHAAFKDITEKLVKAEDTAKSGVLRQKRQQAQDDAADLQRKLGEAEARVVAAEQKTVVARNAEKRAQEKLLVLKSKSQRNTRKIKAALAEIKIKDSELSRYRATDSMRSKKFSARVGRKLRKLAGK